jgi:AraC-like DNA-binding protein
MFYLAGVGLSFFLTLLLATKNKKTIADRILTCWLLIITIHLLLFYFFKAQLYSQLLGVQIPIPLLHGPFLFLYTLALTKGTLSWKNSILHFAPFVLILIYLVPFISLSSEEKILVFKNRGAGYETFNLMNGILINISGVLYVVLSSIALRRHRISIAHEFSSIEKINFLWLQYLIYWIAVIWIFVFTGNDNLVFGAAVFFVLFIGFFGIRQAGVFYSQQFVSPTHDPLTIAPQENEIIEEMPEKRKYQKSGLSQSASDRLHRELSILMREEKIFQESELSLTDLAKRLNTQPNYLSQVINEREGKVFYDYINTIRIQEFKRVAALPESRKYTIFALAEQCGFNSKSSFNRHFKKVTGQSPSEFMKTVRESTD